MAAQIFSRMSKNVENTAKKTAGIFPPVVLSVYVRAVTLPRILPACFSSLLVSPFGVSSLSFRRSADCRPGMSQAARPFVSGEVIPTTSLSCKPGIVSACASLLQSMCGRKPRTNTMPPGCSSSGNYKPGIASASPCRVASMYGRNGGKCKARRRERPRPGPSRLRPSVGRASPWPLSRSPSRCCSPPCRGSSASRSCAVAGVRSRRCRYASRRASAAVAMR